MFCAIGKRYYARAWLRAVSIPLPQALRRACELHACLRASRVFNLLTPIAKFFDIAFWQDFTSNGLATLLGVVVGIPVALAINRKFESGNRRRKLADLLGLYQETLQENRDRLDGIARALKPGVVMFSNVDVLLLEATASLKYEYIDDPELNKRLDELRYELQHIHGLMALQLEIEYGAYRSMSGYTETRALLVESIQEPIPGLVEEIDATLKIIDEQIEKLSGKK